MSPTRLRRWPAAVLGLVVAAAVATPGAAAARPAMTVGGWLPYWSTSASLRSAASARGVLTEASPFWYTAGETGAIATVPGGYSPQAVRSLRTLDDQVIPTVTEAMEAPAAAAFLGNPSKRSGLVSALARLADAHGYDGLDLDFEGIDFDGTPAQVADARAAFSTFVRDLAGALHAAHRTLAVTVGARTSADDGDWAVYDLAAIGRFADRVRVMAYDEHMVGGAPGPIASAPWTARVLSYTTSVISARKVELGIPAYGYEWAVPLSGTCPVDPSRRPRDAVYSARRAVTVAARAGARVVRDAVSGEETFTYTDPTTYTGRDASGRAVSCQVKRVVWYADAVSAAAGARLAARHGIAGIAVWSLGGEDTREWRAIHAAM